MFGIECRAVQIVRLPRGDCNGEAFVEFTSVEDAAKALKKHKEPLNGESGLEFWSCIRFLSPRIEITGYNSK